MRSMPRFAASKFGISVWIASAPSCCRSECRSSQRCGYTLSQRLKTQRNLAQERYFTETYNLKSHPIIHSNSTPCRDRRFFPERLPLWLSLPLRSRSRAFALCVFNFRIVPIPRSPSAIPVEAARVSRHNLQVASSTGL